MLDPLEQRSNAIDRDKRMVELAALALLLPVYQTAQEHAAQAVRLGIDPIEATKSVIQGDRETHQPGIVGPLVYAAVAAWMIGYWRTLATHAAYTTRQAMPVRAVRRAILDTPDPLDPPKRTAAVITPLVDRIGRNETANAIDRAKRFATRAAEILPLPLYERMRGIRIEPASNAVPTFDLRVPPGAHVPDAIAKGMADSRIAFRKSGLDRNRSFLIETTVEADVSRHYEQGRDDGARTPDVAKDLWGWMWSSIIDGRECPRCHKLHLAQAPVDDPLWMQFGSPAHWGCRCARVEVWADPMGRQPTIRRPDMTDADIIQIVNDRRSLERYWQGLTDTQ